MQHEKSYEERERKILKMQDDIEEMFKKMSVYSETIDQHESIEFWRNKKSFADVLKDKQGIKDKEQEQRQRKELENTVKAAIKEQNKESTQK